jgi:hypothetical protein
MFWSGKTRLLSAAADRVTDLVAVLNELARDYVGGWVTFETKKSDRVVEVAFDEPRFILNIPHTEPRGLFPELERSGISFPAGWIVKKDRKKSFFSHGFLEVHIPKHATEELAAFVHSFAIAFLRWPESDSISVTFYR